MIPSYSKSVGHQIKSEQGDVVHHSVTLYKSLNFLLLFMHSTAGFPSRYVLVFWDFAKYNGITYLVVGSLK